MTGMKIQNIAVAQTTVASKRVAQKLSALILKKRLGACVQISPVKSFYRWHGKTESADKFLVSAKTTMAADDGLAAFIKKNHPYELPEIIITGVGADNAYARWVAGETKNHNRANT